MRNNQTTLLILIMLSASLVIALFYYGAFVSIHPQVKRCGGEILIFEEIDGDYRHSTIVSGEVSEALKREFNISTARGFGLYYTDPGKTNEIDLRSDVGRILESDYLSKLDSIRMYFNVKQKCFEECIVVEFPYKGKLSVLFGAFRAYPALRHFARNHGFADNSPIMEIWDYENEKIIYRKKIQ